MFTLATTATTHTPFPLIQITVFQLPPAISLRNEQRKRREKFFFISLYTSCKVFMDAAGPTRPARELGTGKKEEERNEPFRFK